MAKIVTSETKKDFDNQHEQERSKLLLQSQLFKLTGGARTRGTDPNFSKIQEIQKKLLEFEPKNVTKILDNKTEKKLTPNLINEGDLPGQEKNTRRFFHGSHEPIKEINQTKSFEGLFASGTPKSAMSHGSGYLHYMDVPENKIMGPGAPDISDKIIEKHMKEMLGDKYNKNTKDVINNAVIHDIPQHDNDKLTNALNSADSGEAGWEAQRLRGNLAKKLGYHAVAMSDEHGISHLIVNPSQKINKAYE
jgi:hypothetical protein